MINSADLQKPTDLDLHCLLRQGMSCLAKEGLKTAISKCQVQLLVRTFCFQQTILDLNQLSTSCDNQLSTSCDFSQVIYCYFFLITSVTSEIGIRRINKIFFFLFLNKNIYCRYSLEMPQ